MKSAFAVSFLVALTACGGGAPAPAPVPATPEVAARMLQSAPTGAIPVLAAKQAGPAAAVTVTGRIAAIAKGTAAFTLMDPSLPYCGEKHAEGCKTPWDYCCESKATRVASQLAVEAHGADGKPLATPSLGDLRLLDRVAVTGKLVHDEHGNATLVATGWFREQRPTLADGLRWPE
jgi:hypothetical protein